MGFDMEVLLHRTILNKIPNWSRLGRLKRSQPLKGRMSERIATTGRLVCDLKISAKELIRCKSYDLGALIEKLLGKPQESRMEVDVEMMRKAYGSSKALIEVTSHCLQDAADTLKVIFHPILCMCISSICLIFVNDSIFLTTLNTAIRVACSFFRCDLLVLYRTHLCYFTLEINRSEQIVSSANHCLLSV